ncbi:hypothetical protein [Streptomyces olivaceus]|uniref:hypothetical protein n=1 Tax=Streptomyces olivaceus TaxID=47716 RepID=UPI001CCC27E2|nr:hypothetical protein [Streptomyces olivaceus]MBZ6114236.1 hypothetical protein [Streptomyces olivaceus]MBZ6128341.1 hypothetical protein [Streptomyces olivaceus]MBZ6148816.1 hypothetical protein [Streptomyces olivaceus]MBZ6163105.1 hypothetical protein [Streptomyces olivaceus]MBZ6190909.1 hypothetical protein [Streptomyces olivaceus]
MSPLVLLIGVAVGLAAVGGLGYLLSNRPAHRAPVTIMLTASGILIAFAVGVVGIAQASAKEGGAGTGVGVTVSPSGRWPVGFVHVWQQHLCMSSGVSW